MFQFFGPSGLFDFGGRSTEAAKDSEPDGTTEAFEDYDDDLLVADESGGDEDDREDVLLQSALDYFMREGGDALVETIEDEPVEDDTWPDVLLLGQDALVAADDDIPDKQEEGHESVWLDDIDLGAGGTEQVRVDIYDVTDTGAARIMDFDAETDTLQIHYLPKRDPDTGDAMPPSVWVRYDEAVDAICVKVDGVLVATLDGDHDITADDVLFLPLD
ncbi:hypothetical protein [Maritimibacter sp. DP1N21-5]|uniref:hypothetical protein n=1 Tax=Maritimibacter sp. DP1N21-5 TaxID=2836867 RepID=UPI001C46CDC0|nr:hypothetical protein [Maritimibacter sp. DP1N21-5]MBV7410149.1 hypothetical protein [Maritimibacter sp. DP1N21-5]